MSHRARLVILCVIIGSLGRRAVKRSALEWIVLDERIRTEAGENTLREKLEHLWRITLEGEGVLFERVRSFFIKKLFLNYINYYKRIAILISRLL